MVREQGRAGEVRACMPKESGRGKRGRGSQQAKSKASRAKPSWFTTRLTLLGPRLCPWRALSDNQPSMFEHLLLHRKKQTALQVGILKSQSRTLSFQYKIKLFLIILYRIHYTVFILNTNYQ